MKKKGEGKNTNFGIIKTGTMSKIRIENFGPIKEGYPHDEGWMDIKKVTIFIGNQGSGKSTVAKVRKGNEADLGGYSNYTRDGESLTRKISSGKNTNVVVAKY